MSSHAPDPTSRAYKAAQAVGEALAWSVCGALVSFGLFELFAFLHFLANASAALYR